MGFFRTQQEKLAMRLLAWHYQRSGRSVPPTETLEKEAVRIVDDASRIARESGRNVVSIVKELVADLKNKPL